MTARGHWLDDLHPEAYRTLVEGVPAVLYIDRPDEPSTNLYTSPQIEPILGFTVEEWRADPDLWAKQLHPDDVDRALETHRLSNSTASQYLDEYRIRTKDGRTLWIHDEARPVLAEDGSILFWRGVMLDITDRREAEDKLRWSLEVLRRTLQQRRELAQRLQHAQEAERRRIAADIHDDPIQVMSAVDMRLQMLAGYPDSITVEAISEIEQEVAEAIERLRSLLFELRPTALDRDGLVSALRLYADHAAKAAGWRVEALDELHDEPDPDMAALLYRIAQEAIVNVRKHAQASTVRIEAANAADGAIVRVIDDGVGFTPDLTSAPEPGHLGLMTMVERAELAGGWVRVLSAPGKGTTVECWLPTDIAAGDPELADPSVGSDAAVQAASAGTAKPVAGSK
ncbi:MAG: PAS domain-containing protein [Actinomycetota bacterium]|jgi:PAS domain S-box-containing protein